ncbi:MAG: hypothetical protein K2Q20_15230, partial [Phycisphaerales bacterium]|nr:hypothetical protein [Phycisphaerales bacterium]
VERVNAIITAVNAVEGATQRPLIETVPVIASPAGSLEDMTVEMAQSNTGAPLTMFEKGLLAKRLLGYNMTKEDIAAKLSMTERHLNNVLLLASAPAKLRDLIVSDQVTPTTGLKLMKDPKTAAAKAAEMVKASAAKGKAKAQPKDSATKMQNASPEAPVSFKAGDSIKELLQSVAAFIRANVGHGDDDVISTAMGSIKLVISTPAPAPEPKPAKPAKAPKAPKAPKAAKTPAEAKAAAQAHLGTAPAPTPAPAPAGEDLSDL